MSTFGKYDLNDPTWYQKWRKERQEAQQRQEEERKRQEAEAKKKRELEAELDLEDDDAADDVQFEDYEPLWLKGIGKKHPDPVVENASLSAVKAPKPPDDALADISPDVVKEGKLSNLQLEAVAYANMCFGKNLEDGEARGFYWRRRRHRQGPRTGGHRGAAVGAGRAQAPLDFSIERPEVRC